MKHQAAAMTPWHKPPAADKTQSTAARTTEATLARLGSDGRAGLSQAGSTIEQKQDFDRGAQSFKVHLSDRTLLLKVGGELTEDNRIEEILRLFDLWALAKVLEKEAELGVLATRRGLETFRRGT